MLYLLYPSVIVFIVFIVNKQTTSIPCTFEKLATPLAGLCDLVSAGRASEGIKKWVYGMPTDKEVGIRRIPAYTLHYTTEHTSVESGRKLLLCLNRLEICLSRSVMLLQGFHSHGKLQGLENKWKLSLKVMDGNFSFKYIHFSRCALL